MNAVPKNQLDDRPLPERAAAAPRRLVALTHEKALVASLREVAALGADVAVIHDELELTQELMEEPGSIALIDAATISGTLEQRAWLRVRFTARDR